MPQTKTLAVRLADWRDGIRGSNRLIRAEFAPGGKTMYSYLRTHKTRYHRHIGAHFLTALYEESPEILEAFARRHREHGWHFRLNDAERRALFKARDITCVHSQVSNLRYTTNVFDHIANHKQLLRMLGLGAVAGSAGILLGLSELFFFAKEFTRDMLSNTLGISWGNPDAERDRLITLAEEVTAGAVNPDGSLDAGIVAERIGHLVESLETTGGSEAAIKYMTADTSYIVGILTGIFALVIGKGIVHLIVEGVTGTTRKIDLLVQDMDAYCNWKLGRSAFPPGLHPDPGTGPELSPDAVSAPPLPDGDGADFRAPDNTPTS